MRLLKSNAALDTTVSSYTNPAQFRGEAKRWRMAAIEWHKRTVELIRQNDAMESRLTEDYLHVEQERNDLHERNLELTRLVGGVASAKFGDWIIYPKIDGTFYIENLATRITEELPSYLDALMFVRDANLSPLTPETSTVSSETSETPHNAT